MAISKRDFEAIAAAIVTVRREDYTNAHLALDRVAYLLCGYFEQRNNWFDREEFLKASGSK